MAGYLSVFRSLQDEVISLEEIINDIKQSFLKLKTLKNRPVERILTELDQNVELVENCSLPQILNKDLMDFILSLFIFFFWGGGGG